MPTQIQLEKRADGFITILKINVAENPKKDATQILREMLIEDFKYLPKNCFIKSGGR